MKILILTQKVDREDPVLGFFHNWICELSKHFKKVSVICLEKGSYDLPANVEVFSLGKESGRSKIKYVKNFLNLILGLNKEYDSVLVHMNQEYVLLGGFFWKIMGKKVYMWRNHHAGNIMTDIAGMFCDKIFCTSKFSYTAKYKKTKIMPVGINTEVFKSEIRNPKSETNRKILFLGRMSPVKKPDLLVEALEILNKKNIDFSCDFYGDALPKDADYLNSVKNRIKESGLDKKVKFCEGVPNYETPKIYNEHGIYVNLSSDGMYDKTIFEAMACGCLVLASNQNLEGLIDEHLIIKHREAGEVSKKLQSVMFVEDSEKNKIITRNIELAKINSLDALGGKLAGEILSD